PVAIKLLPAALAGDQLNVQRLKREARALGQLSHPNIVATFDFGFTGNNEPYLVMAFVDGHSLSQMLKEKALLPQTRVVRIFQQVADAMRFAHKIGILHRDLKPDNIMISDEPSPDHATILDFGVAQIKGSGETQRLTRAGEVVGSPVYMSPEQCVGRVVDERSDIYSFGISMYESLTGLPAHRGSTILDMVHAKLKTDPPRINDAIPGFRFIQSLDDLVYSCMQVDPKHRFESMADVSSQLKTILRVLESDGAIHPAELEKARTYAMANRSRWAPSAESGQPSMFAEGDAWLERAKSLLADSSAEQVTAAEPAGLPPDVVSNQQEDAYAWNLPPSGTESWASDSMSSFKTVPPPVEELMHTPPLHVFDLEQKNFAIEPLDWRAIDDHVDDEPIGMEPSGAWEAPPAPVAENPSEFIGAIVDFRASLIDETDSNARLESTPGYVETPIAGKSDVNARDEHSQFAMEPDVVHSTSTFDEHPQVDVAGSVAGLPPGKWGSVVQVRTSAAGIPRHQLTPSEPAAIMHGGEKDVHSDTTGGALPAASSVPESQEMQNAVKLSAAIMDSIASLPGDGVQVGFEASGFPSEAPPSIPGTGFNSGTSPILPGVSTASNSLGIGIPPHMLASVPSLSETPPIMPRVSASSGIPPHTLLDVPDVSDEPPYFPEVPSETGLPPHVLANLPNAADTPQLLATPANVPDAPLLMPAGVPGLPSGGASPTALVDDASYAAQGVAVSVPDSQPG
ncbi:MAG: protein kinase, partial [Cyanobacteria bacterium]|nr:protein kinase [Cyanobacteriota bacterium]